MNERQFELAQELEQAQRDAGIQLARARCEGLGAEECTACGDAIPLERRRLVPNATRCVPCQERFEKYKPGYGQ
jgi:phage/conjugal plasmid C-4 type zinc finger TraR family protein